MKSVHRIPCYHVLAYHYPGVFCATFQDRNASIASSVSQSDGRCRGIGVILGGELTYVGVCPILLSPQEDFVSNASLFHHVLSKFLFLLAKSSSTVHGHPYFGSNFWISLHEKMSKKSRNNHFVHNLLNISYFKASSWPPYKKTCRLVSAIFMIFIYFVANILVPPVTSITSSFWLRVKFVRQ
jgi:hypothetical protein